ncbi:MAG: hypothetical protein KKA07_00265 [Bacteroidetes bacterium]|nr:hypothetical protein [Bacteroidota bacterium]MBU1717484.1 hypothetical protein [Bacteroidota bacterium]
MRIHIGELIRQRLEETGISKAEFARQLNCSPQNIYSVFARKSIDTQLLMQISLVLGEDFFVHYNNALQQADGKAFRESVAEEALRKLESEIRELNAENAALKKENSYLAEINQLLKTRSPKSHKHDIGDL